jgi:hypothetical protein
LALYSASHPVLRGGAAPYPKIKKFDTGADLWDLLDGRVELYPVYRRLFYGVEPFRGSVRHALRKLFTPFFFVSFSSFSFLGLIGNLMFLLMEIGEETLLKKT